MNPSVGIKIGSKLSSADGIKPLGSESLNLKDQNNIGDGEGFKTALAQQLSKMNPLKPVNGIDSLKALDASGALKFSNHAIDRMRSRGIQYSPNEMGAIEKAITSARAKGAKETLVLNDKSAMIVNIKNNTVVTVMDKAALKENVFTNIDSTVII